MIYLSDVRLLGEGRAPKIADRMDAEAPKYMSPSPSHEPLKPIGFPCGPNPFVFSLFCSLVGVVFFLTVHNIALAAADITYRP